MNISIFYVSIYLNLGCSIEQYIRVWQIVYFNTGNSIGNLIGSIIGTIIGGLGNRIGNVRTGREDSKEPPSIWTNFSSSSG